MIAFSTHAGVRRRGGTQHAIIELANEAMTTVSSRDGTVEAIPIDEVLEILRSHRALK